ncbi:SF3a splicing factor complex subunit [Coemansia sp. RSA 1853]|nr:SF3a splicing factor complex subunit [Coemansia sp. RSA 1853]
MAADDKPMGLIYPPIDIKAIVDKTAEHVAKSGTAFEQLIREKYEGNDKFSFIYPNDPYFAYYEHMVDQHKSGKPIADQADENSGDVSDIVADKPGENGQPVPERPDAFQFSSPLPAVSAQDLDVIKLTAQYVACNGREFMTALAQREASNYQFDFLSPQHSLFTYFHNLVTQYSLVLFPSDGQREIAQNTSDKYEVLERAKRRMEWTAYEEDERKQKAEQTEQEKQAFLSIDWHDFVVAGTVEFVEEDEFAELPPPMLLQDLKSMSLEDKHKAAGRSNESTDVQAQSSDNEQSPDNEDDDVEMEVEDDVDEEIEAERKPLDRVPITATSLGPMKIRKDYVPNLRRGPRAQVMLQCQLCKLDIPASDFEEHIRVELIDPKWKEQKLTFERKMRDSNLVRQGEDVARYLKQLAEHRGDAHGDESKPSQVLWDGYSSTAGQATRRARQNMTAEEHTVAQQIKQGLDDPRNANIGPRMPPPAQTLSPKRRKK